MKSHPSPCYQKSVLITGCSSGIGRETALHLAKHGFTVFACVRKEADRESLSLLREPELIPIYPLDLTRPGDITQAVEAIQTELQRRGQSGLYSVINNAGGGKIAPVELMKLDDFETELKTRLVGPVALLQALLPLLRQGRGRILWIMTPAALPTPYVTSIHAADFAVNCIIRTLELELKPWNIPCVQIRCGGIDTGKNVDPTALVEEVTTSPRGALYREAIRRWGEGISAFDKGRTPPIEVARVIHSALLAPRPRRRYLVGHMAGLATLLEGLPQGVTDAVLRVKFR